MPSSTVPSSALLKCDYFDAGRCRSCALIETPYAQQLAQQEERCRELLHQAPSDAWLPVSSGGDRGFRNRVKLVAGGAAGAVTLGILGPDLQGVDLRECAIQSPGIAAILPALAAFLDSTGLSPYDVSARRGELKLVHVTESPDGSFMLRFVVRTQHGLDVLRSRRDAIRAAIPAAAVISVNLLPEHMAVLEGEREELLHGSTLPMRLGAEASGWSVAKDRGPLTLHLGPQSFFQTNTAVARELYRQVASWVADAAPTIVWDLYCGVGGFALHCAAALESGGAGRDGLSADGTPKQAKRPTRVVGVELSRAAVDAARRSAREAELTAEFVAADATEYALAADAAGGSARSVPELVIVNPPRRGIGSRLAEWIEGSGVPEVVYSSCNPESLARDLETMPSYAVRAARMFDMFPHTRHVEVAVRLERRAIS